MGTENSNKAVSSLCKVEPGFFDPIDLTGKNLQVGDEITQKNLIISMSPKFTGYFGFGRWYNNMIRKHDGYDYIAPSGTTEVRSVHNGTITKIRFGCMDKTKCFLKDDFNSTPSASFDSQKCKGCDNVERCYGIQVWLKVSGISYFAYYAHLSELSPKIFAAISTEKIKDTNNTLVLSHPLTVCGNEVIGKAGCTGNACNKEGEGQHLHFECRLDSRNVIKCSPNIIVQTEFKIKYTEYKKIPNEHKNKVKEYIEKIEEADIIEYRASNKWIDKKNRKKGYNEEYINMRKEKEKKQNPKLTDDNFKSIKDKIISEWNTWRNWFEYKDYMIIKEKQKWGSIKTETASCNALATFRQEHVLVVSHIKEAKNKSQEVG